MPNFSKNKKKAKNQSTFIPMGIERPKWKRRPKWNQSRPKRMSIFGVLLNSLRPFLRRPYGLGDDFDFISAGTLIW